MLDIFRYRYILKNSFEGVLKILPTKNRILQNRFEGILETLLTKNGMFAKLTGKNNYPFVKLTGKNNYSACFADPYFLHDLQYVYS